MPEQRIAIVGAGVGGLTLALALQQRGVNARIFERAGELVETGAGLSLWGNGMRLLDRLGVAVELGGEATQATDVIFRRGVDGETIASQAVGRDGWYQKQFGAPYYGLRRSDVQTRLVAALQPDTIELGKELVDIVLQPEGAAGLIWADGTASEADVVVAADGVRSIVRQWMTQADSTLFSRTSGFRGVVPRESLPALTDPDCMQFWVGADKHLLHFPIGADSRYINFLAVVEGPEEWADRDVWRVPCTNDEVLAEFAGWHPAVLEMLDAVTHRERWGLFGVGPLTRWVKGNVVLLGDAAHGMLPHIGQGANQTIEDAVALADILAQATEEPLASRLRAYESLRMVRVQRVQQTSWVVNRLLHLPDGAEADERNDVLRDLPRHLRWVHDYDVQAAD
jgi:salicylate hydroxylase